jgi:hypothetical protein
VSKYSPEAVAGGKELYQYSVGVNTNPHDMVFYGDKAYIILYDSPKILIVNPDAENEASFKKGEIDISPWADADGSPEAHMGFVYDNMVYVVLQMYNYNTDTYGTAILLKIDPVTDTVVDMDDSAEGIQGINLIIKNPISGSVCDGRLFLGGTTYGASDEGVMTIDLTTYNQTKLISETSLGGNVAGTNVFNNGVGLVYSYDVNWNIIAMYYDPSTGTLGEKLPLPDVGGGVVMAPNGLIYAGSQSWDNPGMYVVDPEKNEIVGDIFQTELPPYSITYIKGNSTPVFSETGELPAAFSVDAVYPNPFNSITTVLFSLNQPGTVRIEVFKTSGQKVDTLVDSFMSAGMHSVVWNAQGHASGLYYIKVSNGTTAETVKAVFVK